MTGKAKECRNKDRAVRQRNSHNLNNKSASSTLSSISKVKIKSNALSSVVLQKPDPNQTENDDHEHVAPRLAGA